MNLILLLNTTLIGPGVGPRFCFRKKNFNPSSMFPKMIAEEVVNEIYNITSSNGYLTSPLFNV